MTQREPSGLYVYQPLAPTKANPDRLWAIGGFGFEGPRLERLTKAEAERVLAAVLDTEGDRQEHHAEPDERFVPVPVPQGPRGGRMEVAPMIEQAPPKGCPFCGGKAYATRSVNGTQMFHVGCAACGVELKAAWYRDQDQPTKDILALWNTRADTEGDASPSPSWQPIETAPKDGRPVLVCMQVPDFPPNSHRMQVLARFSGDWKDDQGKQMTHWMPLPDPPVQP
jgi:hypothetical protein